MTAFISQTQIETEDEAARRSLSLAAKTSCRATPDIWEYTLHYSTGITLSKKLIININKYTYICYAQLCSRI